MTSADVVNFTLKFLRYWEYSRWLRIIDEVLVGDGKLWQGGLQQFPIPLGHSHMPQELQCGNTCTCTSPEVVVSAYLWRRKKMEEWSKTTQGHSHQSGQWLGMTRLSFFTGWLADLRVQVPNRWHFSVVGVAHRQGLLIPTVVTWCFCSSKIFTPWSSTSSQLRCKDLALDELQVTFLNHGTSWQWTTPTARLHFS